MPPTEDIKMKLDQLLRILLVNHPHGASALGSIKSKVVKQKALPRIDINSAAVKQLAAVPGIGPSIANKIIAGRPYNGKNDLLSRKVVLASTYEKIKRTILAKKIKK